MVLKRKLVKREVIYNVDTLEVEIIDYYKDILEESLHRKILKDIPLWSYFIVISLNVVSLIITDNKFVIGLSTTIILSFSYFIYKRILELKK